MRLIIFLSPCPSKTVFFFTGPATPDDEKNSAILNVTIADNELISPGGWSGVFAEKGVSVKVADCIFANNMNMETGVTASETSSITVHGTLFTKNVGCATTAPKFSALGLAAGDASLVIDTTSFSDNSNYDAQVFAAFRSSISLETCCFIGGSSAQVVFTSHDSDFSGSKIETNFILGHHASTCSSQLFKEDEGSSCFDGGSCTGSCQELASSSSCLVDNAIEPATPTLSRQAPVAPATGSVAPAVPTTGSVAPAVPTTGSVAPAVPAPMSIVPFASVPSSVPSDIPSVEGSSGTPVSVVPFGNIPSSVPSDIPSFSGATNPPSEESGVTPCPNDPSIVGYVTIAGIAQDILEETTRINNGAAPSPPYDYVICPGTTLTFNDGDTTIVPAFHDSTFSCGVDGLGMGCQIAGGTTQFIIAEENLVSGSEVASNFTVAFLGISFGGFSETAFQISGTGNVVAVEYEDCFFIVSSSFKSMIPVRFLYINRWCLIPYVFPNAGFSKHVNDQYFESRSKRWSVC